MASPTVWVLMCRGSFTPHDDFVADGAFAEGLGLQQLLHQRPGWERPQVGGAPGEVEIGTVVILRLDGAQGPRGGQGTCP